MKIKKMVVGLLAGTFLLSIMASPQAVRIGSFADVRNNMVRVLNRRVTYYKDIDPLPYTRLKVGYFKKILEFCYYYRAQLLNLPKLELRWAIDDVIKDNISSTQSDTLLFTRGAGDPMIQYECKMFIDANSFDEVLYNLGIIYLVYKELTEQLEEDWPLCETPTCFDGAINLDMTDQAAKSDELVRRLLRSLVCYFECMSECQRSQFEAPSPLGGASPLGKQEPSTDFVPIFMVTSPEDIAEVCTLKRPASAPCSVEGREEESVEQLEEDVEHIIPNVDPLDGMYDAEHCDEESVVQWDNGMCVKQIIPSESPFPLLSIFGTEHCEEESVEQLEEDVEHIIPNVDPSEDMHDAEDCKKVGIGQWEEKDEKNRGKMGTDTTHDIPIRAKSAPCATISFAQQEQEKEEGNVRGMSICLQSGLPNSDYLGDDSINAFVEELFRMEPRHLRSIPNNDYPSEDSMSASTELQQRMEKGKRQPSGCSATVHDGQTYLQGSGDFTKPFVFGVTSEKNNK